MTTPREGHAATLLPDGNVLVVGGSTPSSESTATAELYDPATGRWTATGSMSLDRASQSATLLHDGKVLVAGGFSADSPVASAELYDPATGQWGPTGSMSTPRARHSATLLPDGRVLVAGGIGHDGALASAELYDPGTGTWSSAGTMSMPRLGHTATLLQNGRVLVAGNERDLATAASAELYNPATNEWTATGSMHVGRGDQTATLLLDGRVLIVGGSAAGPTATAELYDPGSGTWSVTGSMAGARSGHTATLLATGQVLVAGGLSSPSLSAEVYEPVSGVWTTVGPMANLRYSFTATLLGTGQVLVAGGSTLATAEPSAELYTPAPRLPVTLSTTNMAFGAMPVDTPSPTQIVSVTNSSPSNLTVRSVTITGPARGDFTTADSCTGTTLVSGATCTIALRFTPSAIGNREATLVIADNAPTSPQDLALVGMGLPVTGPNTWSLTGAMHAPHTGHVALLLRDGQVLVVGGVVLSNDQSAERYAISSRQWTLTGGPSGAGSAATLLPNGNVLVTGGDGAGTTIYDPRRGTWMAGPPMPTARSEHQAVLLPTGKVLVAGGCCGDSATCDDMCTVHLTSADVYDPRTRRWSATGDMVFNQSHDVATLTVLSTGKVLAGATSDGCAGDQWEVYDPHSGLWRATAGLSGCRMGYTATLLPNGKVLVAGGCTDTGEVVDTAVLYDPQTEQWLPTGRMTTARCYHSATLLLNGTVLVAGGCSSAGCTQYLASAEVYDPRVGTWSPVGHLHTARAAHAATLLPNGQVLVSGGTGEGKRPLTSAELYTSLGLAVVPRTALANQPVTVRGVNFSPREVVSLYWNTPSTHPWATVTTSRNGTFVARLHLPRDRRGQHLIYAIGRRSRAPVSVRVTVG